MSATEFPWECPKCRAPADGHGKGNCAARSESGCMGFICECEDDTDKNHGSTLADPCRHANCYHCGWGGTYPKPPKGLQAWEKKALEAGWKPPAARAAELKRAK